MGVHITELDKGNLKEYAKIPISYSTDYYLRPQLVRDGIGGITFVEEKLTDPLFKDYDQDETPLEWESDFDLSNWVVFVAKDDSGELLGGATVAFNTSGVHMLEGRKDLAVLWDIRVNPTARGTGVGNKLFAAATRWAREKKCTQLKVETQNTNPGACKFYVSQGCKLGGLNRFAYITEPQYAHEVMLLWYLDLSK